MHLYHFSLTLSGSAQPLTTDRRLQGRRVTLQPGSANVGAVQYGGRNSTDDQVVTITDYGVQLPIPVSSVPPAPYPASPENEIISLNDIWVLGTGGDTVKVSYWGAGPATL